MIFKSKDFNINNKTITLRSAQEEDAGQMLDFLKTVAGETRFLVREPEEVTMTLEQEKDFLRQKEASARDLMLLAVENALHIGNCSIASLGNDSRVAHRCGVGIALYQKYCGMGIGTRLLETALEEAKKMGYEQAELEVVSSNEGAVHLYEKLGFKKYGTLPDNMKYKDNTYADCFWMMKKL